MPNCPLWSIVSKICYDLRITVIKKSRVKRRSELIAKVFKFLSLGNIRNNKNIRWRNVMASQSNWHVSTVLHYLQKIYSFLRIKLMALPARPLCTLQCKRAFGAVYGYGTLSVFIISLCSLMGVLLLPCLARHAYYYITMGFIGLSFGTMTGDAFLHLIPQVGAYLLFDGQR